MLTLLSHKTQNENESKMNLLMDKEMWLTMLLLTICIAWFLYEVFKPINKHHFYLYKWTDYVRAGKEKRSQVVKVTDSHLLMRNGDIVFYRDVL